MCGDLSAGTDLLIYKHKVDHGHFKGRLMLVGGNDVKDGIRSFEYLFSNQTGPNLGGASEVTRALGSGALKPKAIPRSILFHLETR